MKPEEKRLLGLRIHDTTVRELIRYLDSQIASRTTTTVWGISLTTLGKLRTLPEMLRFIEGFDIVTADGAGVPILGKLVGMPLKEHVSLPDVSEALVVLAARKGYRMMLFGATAETNAKACGNLQDKHPTLKACAGMHGYFSPSDEEHLVDQINAAAPDILLIGISPPIKERFALKWRDKLAVPVIVACGGMIDIFAGKTRREPRIVKLLAMSWLFRFLQEPRRLFKPVVLPALYFLFRMAPIALFETHVRRNKTFSLARFAGR